jgi:hypothetical protein
MTAKLQMPKGCIDVSREMRGTVIALIGDNVWRAFPAKATKSKAHRPTTSSAPGNDAPRRREGARSPERIAKSAVCAGADETPDSRHSFIR